MFALAEAQILVGAGIVVVQRDEDLGRADRIVARIGKGRHRLADRFLGRRGHRIAGQHRLTVDRSRSDRVLRRNINT
uniref:Uncharacterized protein n=1 Tax=Anopheles coluzzii TaxID=1518534 RepID=A0A8W7PZD3_ANOCL